MLASDRDGMDGLIWNVRRLPLAHLSYVGQHNPIAEPQTTHNTPFGADEKPRA